MDKNEKSVPNHETPKQETLADIVAAKRRLAADMAKSLGDQHSSVETILFEADRIEAAAKRDIEAAKASARPGDAVVLREALAAIVDYYQTTCRSCSHIASVLHQLVQNARVALAKPPRNCDVGTVKEQSVRFHNFCNLESAASGGHCTGCSAICFGRDRCELAWAQLKYEAGYEKGGAQ